MKRVESDIIIQAGIRTVWEAMVSTRHYPDWNPFIMAVEPALDAPIVGTVMEFTVCWKDGSTRKTLELVKTFSPPQPMNDEQRGEWSYSFNSFLSTIGLVKATRKQVITSTQDSITHYHTYEDFTGWGVAFLPIADIKDGFERQAKALKHYCEQT